MACTRYDLYYGGTAGAGNGVLSARYFTCGDRTPLTLSITGGTSGNYYGQVVASTDTGYSLTMALGTGFAEAARASALLAAVFVLCGALSSLMLPNTMPHVNEEAVAAH